MILTLIHWFLLAVGATTVAGAAVAFLACIHLVQTGWAPDQHDAYDADADWEETLAEAEARVDAMEADILRRLTEAIREADAEDAIVIPINRRRCHR